MANWQVLAQPPMPGGQVVVGTGGYLVVGIIDFANPVDPLVIERWRGSTGQFRLDVVKWSLVLLLRDVQLNYSGLWGTTDRRRVYADYEYSCLVVHDAGLPATKLMSPGAGVGIVFHLGDPLQYADPNLSQRYVSPKSLMTEARIVNETPGLVWQTIIGKARAPIFLVPDELTNYQAYLTDQAASSRWWAGDTTPGNPSVEGGSWTGGTFTRAPLGK